MTDAKRTEQIKIMVDELMFDHLKQAAFEADRSVSDFVRHLVALHLYGHVRNIERRSEKTMDGRSK